MMIPDSADELIRLIDLHKVINGEKSLSEMWKTVWDTHKHMWANNTNNYRVDIWRVLAIRFAIGVCTYFAVKNAVVFFAGDPMRMISMLLNAFVARRLWLSMSSEK